MIASARMLQRPGPASDPMSSTLSLPSSAHDGTGVAVGVGTSVGVGCVAVADGVPLAEALALAAALARPRGPDGSNIATRVSRALRPR